MTFTKLLPDDRHKEVLEHVINNISHYDKPSPLMEALVNDAGAEDILDFYRLIKMSPGDVDSLEVTTSEGQAPLDGGYKTFIRNFQGMYSVCEKQIDWSDVTEIALSHLDTQRGFRDTTPVEAGGEFAYAGILIEELCTSQSQHLNHSRGASVQTLDTIQLRCHLQLRRAL
jgi:hypothetical protein